MAIAKHILVGTDFSPAAEAGLEKAAEVARDSGAKLTVVYVHDVMSMLPPPTVDFANRSAVEELVNLEAELGKSLQNLSDERFKDVAQVKTELVLERSPAQAMCEYAKKHDVDLIVVSTHGRTGLDRLLIGSVAEKIVRHAPCSVLVVRSDLEK